jgi:hypothetical protein
MGYFNCKGAACVALAIITSIVWAASYGRALTVHLPARIGCFAGNVTIYRGLASVKIIENSPVRRPAQCGLVSSDEVRAACWDEVLWRPSYAGLSYGDGVTWIDGADGYGVTRSYCAFTFPFWLMVLVCLAVPAARAHAMWQMNRRIALGQCRDCGYELHGLKIDCPACLARSSIIGGASGARSLQPI